MTDAAGAATDYLAPEVLAELVDNLTVEDVRQSREAFEDSAMRGFAAVYFAARRTGVADGLDVNAFLARVRIRDLAPLLERATASLPNGPNASANSPGSAVSGG